MVDNKTDTMYVEIEKYIKINHEYFNNFRFTYFDIREFNQDKDIELLYKVFSDKHILKQSFDNDSNTLNKDFYNELLHIIGLEEVEKGSQKLIQRKKTPDNQSLLENTINIIEEKDKLDNLSNKSNFGKTKDEILFNVSLSLCLRWINRILFLKLLEGQLYKYHTSDKAYKFLDAEKIKNFANMSKLFFSVLAKRIEERKPDIQKDFFRVPYLNSSLFEISTLENDVIDISNLDNNLELPIYKNTVLKDNKGKKLKGNLSTLEYLLNFLNSYDFGAEENEEKETSEGTKNLINASVLGLIFEKINGYKDGSFYTPSFITTYMCRESIQKSVIQKFNEKYNWICNDIEDLSEKIEDKKEANELINTLKICDPAVGSGHFLVSALNEIIALKSELGVLFDTTGKRLKGYKIENYNDELIITDEDDDIFEYKVSKAYDFTDYVERKISSEKTRVQKALFFEKKNLIENCLFGVDINNNSVMICRLRLWIELLKNAFYTEESNYKELETLPNIDINIKQGNSLISRYELDVNLKAVFNKKGFSVKEYREKVSNYKETNSKELKKEILKYIEDIKNQFKGDLAKGFLTKIQSAQNEIKQMGSNLFGLDKETKKQIAEKQKKLDEMLRQKEEIEKSEIYKDAFEWRFEFPEVLDEKGDFSGFDCIIGNPPYVFARENFSKDSKTYFIEKYETNQYQVNTYILFIEKALKILSKNGIYSLIVPNAWLMVSSCKKLREFLLKNSNISEIINLLGQSFEGVNVETIIFNGHKNKVVTNKTKIFKNEAKAFIFTHELDQTNFENNENFEFNVFSNSLSSSIIDKITSNTKELNNLVNIKSGLKAYQTGKGNPKQTENDVKNRPYDYKYKFDKDTHKYLEGKDISRYLINWSNNYLKFGKHLAEPRIFNGNKIIIREITGKYPNCVLATYTEELFLFNMSNIAILEKENSTVSLRYILAILNSTLLSFYFMKNTAKAERKMFPKIILKDLRNFPIKELSQQE